MVTPAEEIREDFLESLQDLTVNSRPVIKTLTEIAQGYSDSALAVVDAIDTHLRRCPPLHKLPAMYLLDSICKSSPNPYATLFASRVASLFRVSFATVQEPVKRKLDELFQTWATVFPQSSLREIAEFLSASSGLPAPASVAIQAPSSSPGGVPPPIPPGRVLNQSSLLVEINRLVKAIESGPVSDHITEKQLTRLSRLVVSVSGPVDPRTFPGVQQDLEAVRADYIQYLNKPSRPTPRSRGPRKPANVSGSIQNSGSMSNGSWTGTNNVPLGTRKRKPASEPLKDETIEAKKLEHALKSLSIDLKTAAAQPASSALVEQFLYAQLPLQCSTCGKRFPDTAQGRDDKQAEMDWHFRVNKDLREGHSRNRLWFLDLQRWVEYRDDVHSTASEQTKEQATAGASGDSGTAVDLESEKRKYVLVPASSEGSQCPVCQEQHRSTWSDDEEDWVWLNCIEMQGLYFHATCYADPSNRAIVTAILEDATHAKKEMP